MHRQEADVLDPALERVINLLTDWELRAAQAAERCENCGEQIAEATPTLPYPGAPSAMNFQHVDSRLYWCYADARQRDAHATPSRYVPEDAVTDLREAFRGPGGPSPTHDDNEPERRAP